MRVLADFAPGSHHRFAWTDHNSKRPTLNLTIVDPVIPAASYAQFSGTVYANTGYTYISTIAPAFKKIDLSDYDGVSDGGIAGASIVIEARYPKAHHCYARPGGGGAMCHFQGFKMALLSSKGAFFTPKDHSASLPHSCS